MNNETLHIDDLLSSTFAGFEPAMPAMAWEGIANKLDEKKRRGGFIWWKAAAVALIVAGAWGTYHYALKSNKPAADTQIATPAKDLQGGNNGNAQIPGANSENNAATGSNAGTLKEGNETQSAFKPAQPKQNPVQNIQPELQIQNNTQGNTVNPPQSEIDAVNWTNIAENEAQGIESADVTSEEWATLAQALNQTTKAKEVGREKPFANRVSPLMFGFGVGQVVSNTNYSIASGKSAYVHPDFKSVMAKSEGILSSMSFNASVYFKLNKELPLYLTAGASFYQRKNSLNFDFDKYTFLENSTGNVPKDKFGNDPFGEFDNGVYAGRLQFKGSNSFTQFEIPVGVTLDKTLGKSGWSLMPTVSGNLGFITQKSGYTLDYHEMDVISLNPTWYRNHYFTLNSSLGIYKNLLNDKFKLGVSASGSYMLNSMYVPGASIKPKAFTGGLSTQLIWRID